jgi:hypothetical protein
LWSLLWGLHWLQAKGTGFSNGSEKRIKKKGVDEFLKGMKDWYSKPK